MVDTMSVSQGSHRILGRSHFSIPVGCEKFLARKQACELANLKSPRKFLARLAEWQKKVDNDPNDACARTFVDTFHAVARERNITIPVA